MRWMLLCTLLLLSCQKPKTGPPAESSAPSPTASKESQRVTTPAPLVPTTELSGESLYQLDLTLTDQDGQKLPLTAFRGQPVIISMFYAHCPNACPMLIHKIQTIEDKLSEAERKELRVLLVSFAPDTDTNAVLKGLATKQTVDEKRWRLTRTHEASVRELATVLGISYRKLDDGNYNHASVLTLLDRGGQPVAKLEGLAEPIDSFLLRLRSIAQKH